MSLINGDKVILDDADLLVNKFGKIEEIKRYTNALYIDIDEKEFYQKRKIWNEIQIYVDNYTQKIIARSDHNDSFIQIPNEKNILGRGFWYCSTGATLSKHLIELADMVLKEFSDKINLKCVVFSQLPEELRIKSTSKDKSKFKYGNFWLQVSLLNEQNSFEFNVNSECAELVTIMEDKDKLTDEFEKLSKNKRLKYNQIGSNVVVNTKSFSNSKFKINKYLMNAENNSNTIDIGIITIVSQETRAVLKFLEIDSKSDELIDGRSFYTGVYNSSNNNLLKIAVTQQLEPGNRSVIIAYNSLVKNFKPKLIAIVGIAGGISKDLSLCDVVIANQVIYYENKKETKDKTNRRGDIFKMDPKIKQIINKFFIAHDEPAIFNAESDSFKPEFKILTGSIGSGEAVIADESSQIKKWLQEVNSKCLAVEMEAGGFLQAFYEDGLSEDEPKNGAIVIRGISDHADYDKDDKWRKPASENAVRCLFEMIKLM
jgi:adenosylhomocysteine nucleosidase